MELVQVEPLSAHAFAEFGDVIEIDPNRTPIPINDNTTQRYHDLATSIARGNNARVVLSIARATPFDLPISLNKMERHPFGSQAFVPLTPSRFLVIVAPDEAGKPGQPQAFLAAPGQGINYALGTWHAVLTALDQPTDFLIVDRAGDEDNLEEHVYPERYLVTLHED